MKYAKYSGPEEEHKHKEFRDPANSSCFGPLFPSKYRRKANILVHHNAATRNAAMHNAIFSHRNSYPNFLQRHRCDALPCFSASPVIIFYIAHIAFPPLLPFFLSPQWFTVQKQPENLPRVTTQRCRHWQRGMDIANANANAAMRCTKANI